MSIRAASSSSFYELAIDIGAPGSETK